MQPENGAGEDNAEDTVAEGTTQHDDPASMPETLDLSGGPRSQPVETVDTPLRTVGNYELLEVIARGGMGVVYRARQKRLNRIVAVKMILAGQFAREADLQRFRVEAEAAAKLNHPNIVPVYETGEHEGEQYFSMEYVDGQSLAERVADGPLAPDEAVSILCTLAEAMGFAHSKGVIHRDLKPGNILLDRSGHDTTPGQATENSGLTPRVTDFGLAKKIDDGRGLTMTGQALGTPGYMPPEQAAGNLQQVGPAADIYSLGAILYCLLTGRPPFQADTPFDTMLQVIDQEPAPPRILNPKIPVDVETICLKCLEKEPNRRYATALDLAADLKRYSAGDSISARGYNILERLKSTVTRSRDDVKFQNFGNMFLMFAAVTLATDLTVTLILFLEGSYTVLALVQYGRLAAYGLIFWLMRPASMLATSTTTGKQLLSICCGFIISATVYGASDRILHRTMHTSVEAGIYPGLTAISGLAFFAMAASYWGGCYVIGAVFFVAALVMPLVLNVGPLIFGVIWATALTIIGLRMKAFAREQVATSVNS